MPTLTEKEIEIRIDLWKKIVDVQMHFNELGMKIRNFAVLILAAFIGAAGVALKDDIFVTTLHIPLASLFCLACVLVCGIFYFMDQMWYHPLLIGSVAQGIKIENELKEIIPNIDLAIEIKKHSNSSVKLFGMTLQSKHKARVFYIVLALIFTVMSVILYVTHYPTPDLQDGSTASPCRTLQFTINTQSNDARH